MSDDCPPAPEPALAGLASAQPASEVWTILADSFRARPGAAADLDRLAHEAFGDNWPIALARFAGVNVRTCQRVRASAAAGDENAAAAGLLAAYAKALIFHGQAVIAAAEGGRGART